MTCWPISYRPAWPNFRRAIYHLTFKLTFVRKLKVPFLAFGLIAFLSIVSCKKTTNNTTVVKDSVFYSNWTTLEMDYDNTDTVYPFFKEISDSRITNNFISTGAVITYLANVQNGDTVLFPASENGLFTLLYQGGLQVYAANDYSGDLFRYVLIPGTVLTGSSFKGYTQKQLSSVSFTDLQKGLSAASATTAAQ